MSSSIRVSGIQGFEVPDRLDAQSELQGIEDAMISDVQEIEQFAKPRSLGEPQTHFRHWLRSEKCYATEEQSRKKARQVRTDVD